jgi:SAM-dependent methyltransferase
MAIADAAFAEPFQLLGARSQVPDYAPMLAAYQRGHAEELRAMVADLPLRPGDRVLDMACGGGTYTVWLAEQVAPDGAVVGVDICPAYLAIARAHADEAGHTAAISFQTGDIAALPFDDNTFDLVWCAQSMYSLPDALGAMRELRRVTRPGGTVAVFENDTLHQVVLPWPAELELAIRRAQLRAFGRSAPASDKHFIGRDLRGVFARAGLASCVVTPYASVRHAPLNADERSYLGWYFAELAERARPQLDPLMRAWFDRLLDARSGAYLLDQPDFYVIYLNMVARGIKNIEVD